MLICGANVDVSKTLNGEELARADRRRRRGLADAHRRRGGMSRTERTSHR
jgi:hypothetical protein